MTISTDASKLAWGGHLHNQENRQHGGHMDFESTRAKWPLELQSEHIHILEMHAVLNTLTAFTMDLSNKAVRLLYDNQTVVAAIRNNFSKSAAMRQLLLKLNMFCVTYNCYIIPQWVSTHCNKAADTLSRINL